MRMKTLSTTMAKLDAYSDSELALRYQNLFQASQDGILTLDYKTGKIESANPLILKLLGFTEWELVGKELWEIGAILDKEAALGTYKVLKSHGHVRYNNLPLLNKAGGKIQVEFICNVYELDHHPIIQCLIRDLSKEQEAELIIAKYKDAVSTGFDEIANAFSTLMATRDSYTAGHQIRVARLVKAIGEQMQLDPNVIKGIHFAATIHDLGKMGVPSEILSKPGTLSTFEISMLRNHAKAGYDVVKHMQFPWPVAQTILQHHERLDGSGYPYQLRGSDIILEARILAVADTVEAMSNQRPYRTTPGLDNALQTIRAGRGVLFDSDVVDACLKVFAAGFKFDGATATKSHETEHL